MDTESKLAEQLISFLLREEAAATPAADQRSSRQIVKVEGGWIFYGDVSYEGDTIHVRNGGTVRYYNEPDGGLNRLASNKPSSKTKLDPASHISFPASRLRATVHIEEGGI